VKQLCLPVLKNRQSFAISNSPDERVQSGPVLCASVKCHLLIVVYVMTHAPFISASQVFFSCGENNFTAVRLFEL